MSQLRRFRRSIRVDKVKVAYAMEHLLKVAGSHEELCANFPAVFERAYQQTTRETYAPATKS